MMEQKSIETLAHCVVFFSAEMSPANGSRSKHMVGNDDENARDLPEGLQPALQRGQDDGYPKA